MKCFFLKVVLFSDFAAHCALACIARTPLGVLRYKKARGWGELATDR